MQEDERTNKANDIINTTARTQLNEFVCCSLVVIGETLVTTIA